METRNRQTAQTMRDWSQRRGGGIVSSRTCRVTYRCALPPAWTTSGRCTAPWTVLDRSVWSTHAVFTSASQVHNLVTDARDEKRARALALNATRVASIGPVCSAALPPASREPGSEPAELGPMLEALDALSPRSRYAIPTKRREQSAVPAIPTQASGRIHGTPRRDTTARERAARRRTNVRPSTVHGLLIWATAPRAPAVRTARALPDGCRRSVSSAPGTL
jgi:hypothetical protein